MVCIPFVRPKSDIAYVGLRYLRIVRTKIIAFVLWQRFIDYISQLLCITRVMLCLPPMLILDEATSSIDTRTEIRIQKAFLTMMKGRTSFIVAHRLSTIREADSILVMKDGKIIEKGNHEELLAAGGFYATLYQSQFAV